MKQNSEKSFIFPPVKYVVLLFLALAVKFIFLKYLTDFYFLSFLYSLIHNFEVIQNANQTLLGHWKAFGALIPPKDL